MAWIVEAKFLIIRALRDKPASQARGMLYLKFSTYSQRDEFVANETEGALKAEAHPDDNKVAVFRIKLEGERNKEQFPTDIKNALIDHLDNKYHHLYNFKPSYGIDTVIQRPNNLGSILMHTVRNPQVPRKVDAVFPARILKIKEMLNPVNYPKATSILIGLTTVGVAYLASLAIPTLMIATLLTSTASYTALRILNHWVLRDKFHRESSSLTAKANIDGMMTDADKAYLDGIMASDDLLFYASTFLKPRDWIYYASYRAGIKLDDRELANKLKRKFN